ncbi:membrane hypothetical protein [uncultured Gammaproteobacteria bacterium]
MRKLVALVALVALVSLGPVVVGTALAQTQTQPQTQAPTIVRAAYDPVYPLVLAAGALTGVVSFTLLSGGLWTLPLPGAVGRLAGAPAGIAGINRIYAVASAVVGVWISNWLYTGR